MTRAQKEQLQTTELMHDRQHSVFRSTNELGDSPWWFLPGLRRKRGTITVGARFALFWGSEEVERSFQESGAGLIELHSWKYKASKRFEQELKAAGMIASESLHCEFLSGPWRN